jgi:uncharacterized membrane protein
MSASAPADSYTLPRIFLVLSLVFGNLFVAIIPPFQAADEPFHFLRAYQITDGAWAPRQADIRGIPSHVFPASLFDIWLAFSHIGFHTDVKTSYRDIRRGFEIPLDPGRKMLIALPNTSHYSPLCYLPQCLGISIGRLFGAAPLMLMYLGREGNMLAWALMGYLALRIAPAIARPLFLLLMMPMAMYLAATNSADAPTSGFAILFTAVVLRYSGEPANSIDVRRRLILLLLCAAVCLCKFAYAPLLLLLFLIPPANFGPPRKYAISLAILFLAGAAAWAIWTYECSASLNSRINSSFNVVPSAQFDLLRQHPLHFAPVLWNTFRAQGWTILKLYVGLIGWYDVLVPSWFAAVYLAALFLSCVPISEHFRLPPLKKISMTILPASIISLFLIAFLSFLYWTPVGASQIDGIHGRYLIPLTPAVFILLSALLQRTKLPLRPRAADLSVWLLAILTSTYFAVMIWNRYYG